MMRIVQITFLWLAGALVLGHGLIPHHHHEADQQHCNKEQKSELHTLTLHAADNCSCNHQEPHLKACSIDIHTVVEQTQILSSAIYVDVFNLQTSHFLVKNRWYRYLQSIPPEFFFKQDPSRAPPVI